MGKLLLATCYRIRKALKPSLTRPGLTPWAWAVRPVGTTGQVYIESVVEVLLVLSIYLRDEQMLVDN
jgi:hypothetical protein